MTKFAGVNFCGTRGGQSFLNAERPDPTTKECKDGYTACSEETSPDNTICVQDGQEKLCPITYLKFVDSDKVAKYENDTDVSV